MNFHAFFRLCVSVPLWFKCRIQSNWVPPVSWICPLFLSLAVAGPLCAATLTWEPGDGFRSATLAVGIQGKTGFQKLDASQLGIFFTNQISQTRSILNRNLLNGSGVAAGDVNGDGWCDLYFCGVDSDNVLYRNLGNWKFEDITQVAGVACPARIRPAPSLPMWMETAIWIYS